MNGFKSIFLPPKTTNFSIISNNCVGGVVYEDLEIPYTTPTVGVFFFPNCYLKFLSNIEHYLDVDEFVFSYYSKYFSHKSSYPIGIIDDIEVHFMHYPKQEEAMSKWNNRKKRIIWDNLFVIMNDRDGCTQEHISKFLALKYENKCFFTHTKIKAPNTIWIKESRHDDCVGDLYSNRWVLRKYFDIHRWVTHFNYPKHKRPIIYLYRKLYPFYYKIRRRCLKLQSQ